MSTQNYDVLIVGGGPAGAAAGLRLAQAGLRVAILEKATLPRVKPCGGGLTYRILARFPQLQAHIERLVLNRVDTIHFYAPDLSCVRYTYPEPLVLMIRRAEFDAMLLTQCQLAGVTVVTAARVNDLTVQAAGVAVKTSGGETFFAKALIGADGVNSIVARKTGLRKSWTRAQVAASLVAEIPRAELAFQDQTAISILFGLSGFGYGWVFPKQQYVNLGVAGLRVTRQDPTIRTVYAQFLRLLANQGLIPPSFEPQNARGGLIPLKGVLPQTQTGRVLLCGDAAGFVNAFTGEGIYYAMVSGDLAAQTLAQAFRQNDFSVSALARYQTAWQAEIGAEITESLGLQQRLCANVRFTNLLVRTVEAHPRMKKIFADYFMGKMTYAALKHELIWRFLPQYLKLQCLKMFDYLKKSCHEGAQTRRS